MTFVKCDESKIIDNLSLVHRFVSKKIENIDSYYKRKKQIHHLSTYVAPVEKAIGYRWESTHNEETGGCSRKIVQNSFQYIPVLKTLLSLFSNPEYMKIYMEHNLEKDHVCQDNLYIRFCCGSSYKSNEFFEMNPLAIQTQLYTDDFEPCDALKSRAGKNKKTAFYMRIRNMPEKSQSKLWNIYLVAIANSQDLKGDYTSINNILEVFIINLFTLKLFL